MTKLMSGGRSLCGAILCAALFSGVSGGALAQEPTRMNIHNSNTRDVLGVWDLVAIKAEDKADTLGPPYQRWIFRKDGVMRHIASNDPITEEDMKTNEALPPNTRFKVKDSILDLQYQVPPMKVSMRSFIVDKTFPENMRPGDPEEKGDMILAAYRKGPITPDVLWVLRKKK